MTRLTSEHLDRLAADVARVAAPVFEERGWEWCSAAGVPDTAVIERTLRRLMDSAGRESVEAACSGRFSVMRYIEDGIEECSISLELGHVYADEDRWTR